MPQGYGLKGCGDTVLRFEQEAMLFTWSPLDLVAPPSGSIRFEPQGEHWAGIMVLRAGTESPSHLLGVQVVGTSGFARRGWTATGGITFYESPLVMEQVTVSEGNAEDALNVVRGTVTISDSLFCSLASDAFDGDSASVVISDSTFRDIRGDAIDVSASDALVQNVDLLRVRDKGISAGEASTVLVRDARLREIAIGIASKDLSHVAVTQCTFQQATIAGLAAYVKKPEYGTARIEADNITFADDSPRALAQVGSSIRLGGKAMLPQELDVDELYVRLEALSDLSPVSYALGPSLRLTGYHFYPRSVQPGDRVYLLLRWAIAEPVHQDYSVFAHLLDPANERVAQNDGMPRDNSFPTSRWVAGQIVEELRPLTVPEDAGPGDYAFYVGMYDYTSGVRLPVTQDGVSSSDAAIWLPSRLQVLR